MADFSVHLGLLGPARRAGPSPLRSARKRRRGQGGRAPGPRPASFRHRALRPAWRLHSSSRCPLRLGGTCPPARGPLLPATGRCGPRGVFTLQAGARSTWGDVPPDRGPPLPATEHYGSRGAFTLQSWWSQRLGERLPRLAACIYSLPGATARVASSLIKPGGRRPPTAARPRSSSLVVVTRRSRLATSRDYPSGAAAPGHPLITVDVTARGGGRGDVISPPRLESRADGRGHSHPLITVDVTARGGGRGDVISPPRLESRADGRGHSHRPLC
jgi:hypothetical protein